MAKPADVSSDSSSQAGNVATPREPKDKAANPDFSDVTGNLKSALYGGLGAGFVGLLYGGSRGILKSAPPIAFAAVSGIQWFVLGSSYTFARRSIISSWGGNDITTIQKTAASTIAGGFAGGAVGSLRGLRNVPGSILPFAIVGGAGQLVFGLLQGVTLKPRGGWLASKYSPLTPVSDQDYAKMLEEKLLGVEADMALLDEKIEAARARVKAREEESRNRDDGTH